MASALRPQRCSPLWGHTLLLHGRNADKLTAAASTVSAIKGAGEVKTYQADLSNLEKVRDLAAQVKSDFKKLDVLINNAGVFKTPAPTNADGYDVRFIVMWLRLTS